MKICLAGQGAFGIKHLEALAKIDGIEVVSLAGGRPESTKEVAEKWQIPHWTTHDLRRTCRSNLAALGVPPVVAEAVIGHRQRGILQVYDRHSYSSEKRDALTLWQEKLISIVAG